MNDVSQTPETIFGEAIEISSQSARALFLDGACQGNAVLRHEVEKLVEDHFRAGSFLESPPAGLAATLDLPESEKPGTIIGPYKLRELLGEGGMGSVYVAEQQEPVRRKVALKIIKPGMDSRQVLARFEAERQVLALMDHPNIARVLDAGTTGGSRDEGLGTRADNAPPPALTPRSSPLAPSPGRPYFVMELVRGVPITEFCDQRQLDPRQRLALFIQVCRAIQHAHQKGIIHRDIKPSNILVTLHDDLAVPKVIDFGIAKATGQQLTEQTIYTAFNQMIGTPLYMSPEQAEMNALDVDTRSDVYSLGVLLYELLTGSTPFDSDTLRQAGFDEMRRIIREVDPPRPSQRVSTLGAQAASTVSQSRGIDERHFSRVLHGELDLIVMKALEKDRNRRYESASALAADVQRYLNDEPVEACPPSAAYRFRKFARRNKAALLVASTALLLLMFATGMVADRQRQVREATRFVEISREAAWTALVADDVQQAVLRLSEAQTRIDADRLADQPLVEEVATLLQEAERYIKFVPLLEKAQFYRSGEQADIAPADEALALYDVIENPKWLDAVRAAGPPEAQITRVADGVYELLLGKADSLSRWSLEGPDLQGKAQLQKQCPQALECLDKAISFHAPSRGYYWLLANCSMLMGDQDKATRLRQTALATPVHHAAELFYIQSDHGWGTVSHNEGYPAYPFEQWYKDLREMLRFDRTYYNGFFSIAALLYQEQRYQEALPVWYACVAMRPDDTSAIQNRGFTHWRLKQYDEAVADANIVIAQKPDYVGGWTLRGKAYRELKQHDKALEDFNHVLELQSASNSSDFPLSKVAWLLATEPMDEVRDGKRAVELATKACEMANYRDALKMDTLAAAYAESGDFEAATQWAEKAFNMTSDVKFREKIEQHLNNFRNGKPWRE